MSVEQETLFGFVGTIRGNESNLVAMDAISVAGDEYIRYPAGEGVAPRTLRPRELAYVHRLDHPSSVRWQPGEAIWFAGRNLVARSATNTIVRTFAVDWHATQQGHRIVGGTPAGLRRARDNYAGKLSTLFRQYVLDSEEVQFGEARAVWELLQAFDNVASKRRSLNAGLYAKDVENSLERFDAVRLRAVRSGAFSTTEEFDAELDRLRTWMAEPMLSRTVRVHTIETPAPDFHGSGYAVFAKHLMTSWQRPAATYEWLEALDRATESGSVPQVSELIDRLRKERASTP